LINLKRIASFHKVTYYSVLFEGELITVFEQFLSYHTSANKDKLNHIIAWIKVIGDKIGAKRHYFRNESNIADTSALPPIGMNSEPSYIEYDEITGEGTVKPNNLRLYCFRANDSVVVLFNGDIKTKAKAQKCESVKAHFYLAN